MQNPPFFKPNHTYIIAEAGVNHNGDVALAKQLIDGAKEAGADAVKFQLFNPDVLTTEDTPLAAYQEANGGETGPKSQRELLSALALSQKDFQDLYDYATQTGIQFLCSPFDEDSARFLIKDLALPCIKLSSGELTNLPFLKMLSGYDTPVILSTGMATMAEVETAVKTVYNKHRQELALLHCVSSYPTPLEQVNLRAMTSLENAFPDCIIGYSDHTEGITISLAAVALGARIIEKHFTLDKTLPGPDHKASLSVEELTEMIQDIRNIEKALGSGVKEPQPCEADCKRVARKRAISTTALTIGTPFSLDSVIMKRSDTGIPADEILQYEGWEVIQRVEPNKPLTKDMFRAPSKQA